MQRQEDLGNGNVRSMIIKEVTDVVIDINNDESLKNKISDFILNANNICKDLETFNKNISYTKIEANCNKINALLLFQALAFFAASTVHVLGYFKVIGRDEKDEAGKGFTSASAAITFLIATSTLIFAAYHTFSKRQKTESQGQWLLSKLQKNNQQTFQKFQNFCVKSQELQGEFCNNLNENEFKELDIQIHNLCDDKLTIENAIKNIKKVQQTAFKQLSLFGDKKYIDTLQVSCRWDSDDNQKRNFSIV